MVDILAFVVEILTFIMVLISTIFTQKGFSNINKWFDVLREDIKKIDTSKSIEPEKCKKCGKLVDDHTIGEAKKCGLITKQ